MTDEPTHAEDAPTERARRARTAQYLKPSTSAKKLGILLDAAPAEFRDHDLTREELQRLLDEPPEWLAELRRRGPHPRPVVAAKLGVSASGLARAGVTEPLTTDEIQALLADRPEWLQRERATQAAVRAEDLRVKEARRAKAERTEG